MYCSAAGLCPSPRRAGEGRGCQPRRPLSVGAFMTSRLMDGMVSCMDCLLVIPFSPYVHLFVIRANEKGAVPRRRGLVWVVV